MRIRRRRRRCMLDMSCRCNEGCLARCDEHDTHTPLEYTWMSLLSGLCAARPCFLTQHTHTHTHTLSLFLSLTHTCTHRHKQSGFVCVFPVPFGAVLARGGRPPQVTLAEVLGFFAARPARTRAMAAARGALPPRACGVGHRRPGNKVNGELQQARRRARVAAEMKCGATV